MKIIPSVSRLLATSCMLLVAGCGGGSGSSDTNPSSGGSPGGSGGSGITGFEIAANFIKGPVVDGSCELFQVTSSGNRGSSLGVAGNSVDGLAEFPDRINYTGTVLLECSSGTYMDEATGNALNAPLMRAVANLDVDSNFVVSPLTEMAFQLAEAEGDLDEALRLMKEDRLREEITGRAYSDVVESGTYTYSGFARLVLDKSLRGDSAGETLSAAVLTRHRRRYRRGWVKAWSWHRVCLPPAKLLARLLSQEVRQRLKKLLGRG